MRTPMTVYEHGIQEVPQAVGMPGLVEHLNEMSHQGWEAWQVQMAAKTGSDGKPAPMFLVYLRRKKANILLPSDLVGVA